jgi:hypothetical protein
MVAIISWPRRHVHTAREHDTTPRHQTHIWQHRYAIMNVCGVVAVLQL